MASTSPFHLAFTVRDISETRALFGGLLGCTEDFARRGEHRERLRGQGAKFLLEPRVRCKGAHEQGRAVAGALIERRNAMAETLPQSGR